MSENEKKKLLEIKDLKIYYPINEQIPKNIQTFL